LPFEGCLVNPKVQVSGVFCDKLDQTPCSLKNNKVDVGKNSERPIIMLGGISNKFALVLTAVLIAGCGGINSGSSSGGGLFGGARNKPISPERAARREARKNDPTKHDIPLNNKERQQRGAAALDLNALLNPANDNADIRVNKYLWAATLETLNFLPIEAADPFSGIVVMGWGRAPGSSTDFRATVLIQDPALEAGSLKVAMQKRRGPASAETNRRIEDAILTRARQLRIRAAKRR